jgi:FtsH-binding integral membrane protein
MDALTQFLLLALIVYITAIPGFKLLKRIGMSYWWEILLIIPIFGLLLFIWIIAFARWSIKDTEDMAEGTRSRAASF